VAVAVFEKELRQGKPLSRRPQTGLAQPPEGDGDGPGRPHQLAVTAVGIDLDQGDELERALRSFADGTRRSAFRRPRWNLVASTDDRNVA
jgi:hypothetical protein